MKTARPIASLKNLAVLVALALALVAMATVGGDRTPAVRAATGCTGSFGAKTDFATGARPYSVAIHPEPTSSA
ncbi:MAG: hypothetical protein M3P30_03785 [Chloroflexota bacterium]|nr:hypothetical protein [Chloroflexota bacterium]